MQDPQKLIQRFKSRVHVLDGGLATELEKRGHDISGKLWSAQVLLDDPGAIEQLHYDYLKAGADIIITSSYQLTFQGMKEAGYTHEQAEEAFQRSVMVAINARHRYLSELADELPEERKPLIAASIGPYGAYLADGSEYRGDYAYPEDWPSDPMERLKLLSEDKVLIEELSEFHQERFDILRDSEADLVAIETIPNEWEAYELALLASKHPKVPVWMSFTCTRQGDLVDGSPMGSTVLNVINRLRNQLVALGANCVSPAVVRRLVGELRAAIDFSGPDANSSGFGPFPIIVYPNSGEGWDAEHRCWVGENDAEHFAEYAREWIRLGANIIGGCCRTGPEHIAQLRKLVDSLEQA